MKNFSFPLFDNKSKAIQKKRYNIITTKKICIWNFEGFVLEDKKTIVYKKDERNRNLSFLIFFQKYEKPVIDKEQIE